MHQSNCKNNTLFLKYAQVAINFGLSIDDWTHINRIFAINPQFTLVEVITLKLSFLSVPFFSQKTLFFKASHLLLSFVYSVDCCL